MVSAGARRAAVGGVGAGSRGGGWQERARVVYVDGDMGGAPFLRVSSGPQR